MGWTEEPLSQEMSLHRMHISSLSFSLYIYIYIYIYIFLETYFVKGDEEFGETTYIRDTASEFADKFYSPFIYSILFLLAKIKTSSKSLSIIFNKTCQQESLLPKFTHTHTHTHTHTRTLRACLCIRVCVCVSVSNDSLFRST